MTPEGGRPSWRVGYDSLRARVRALPDILGSALVQPMQPLRLAVRPATGFVVTGVGSSAAHARFLVSLLVEGLGLRARFQPLGDFLDPSATDTRTDVLVVISQGLSPNARVALRHADQWAGVALLTATTAAGAERDGKGEKATFLAELQASRVDIHPFSAGEDEYGTLVRVVGPLVGYLAAIRLAHALATALGRTLPIQADQLALIPARVAEAPAAVATILEGTRDLVERLGGPLTLLATGSYAELADNLRYKILEGMLRPLPPIFDLLHLAHGPYQQMHAHPMTLLALSRTTSASETALLARVETMLVPERHTLVRLSTTLPGPLAIFEHEALMNDLMLRVIEANAVDQVSWPGQAADAPLYDVSVSESSGPSVSFIGARSRVPARTDPAARRLEMLTWPEMAGLLAAEPLTAVVPLGSTEQHGPHLPFATDTRIAEALGLRFCARVPEAILLPALPLGCASEHMGFQGTLDLRAETLSALLVDLVASLRTHGFARAFIFSAHGGNIDALAEALPTLRVAGMPMLVGAHAALADLTRLWHDASAEHGVGAAVSGHHAGEYETSIVRALWPDAVREDALAQGLVTSTEDSQALFYPSLATHAPSGTVGDPRAADAARGERYLEAWVTLLVSTYQLEKKSAYATGR